MFPLVRELAAAGAPVRVSVAVACRVLGFSKQAYYQWLANPVSDRDWDEAHLINAARDVWDEDRCQGYRLISDELVDDGWQVSERRVWRVCSRAGMFLMALIGILQSCSSDFLTSRGQVSAGSCRS